MARTYGHIYGRSNSWNSPHARNVKSKDKYTQHQRRREMKEVLLNNDIEDIDIAWKNKTEYTNSERIRC
jgi:hypothetical protein